MSITLCNAHIDKQMIEKAMQEHLPDVPWCFSLSGSTEYFLDCGMLEVDSEGVTFYPLEDQDDFYCLYLEMDEMTIEEKHLMITKRHYLA